MTKKRINQLLIVMSILLMGAWFVSNSSNSSKPDIQEVLGSWHITKASLKKIKGEGSKAESTIVTSFELNSDSTVSVYLGGSEEKRIDGTWNWQVEKKLGNKKFGISMYCDVVIRVPGYTLGLQLNKKRRTNYLTARDYTFEKQR